MQITLAPHETVMINAGGRVFAVTVTGISNVRTGLSIRSDDFTVDGSYRPLAATNEFDRVVIFEDMRPESAHKAEAVA